MDKERYSLIIVIGLPCSGKTTYCKEKLKNYFLHDDFISNFFDCSLMDDIKNKRKVVITDPRLCNLKTFHRYMDTFLEYIEKNEIKIILFKNDLEKSIKNYNKLKKKRNVLDSIKYYSHIYNLSNYTNYNITII